MTWLTALPFFSLLNVELEQAYHCARFEKGSRYYILRLEKDLLDDWTVIAINGRIKSKLGQSRTMAFPNFIEAFVHFCQMSSLRYQRGYHLITYRSEDALVMHLVLLYATRKPITSVVKEQTSRKVSSLIKTNTPKFIPSQQMGFMF